MKRVKLTLAASIMLATALTFTACDKVPDDVVDIDDFIDTTQSSSSGGKEGGAKYCYYWADCPKDVTCDQIPMCYYIGYDATECPTWTSGQFTGPFADKEGCIEEGYLPSSSSRELHKFCIDDYGRCQRDITNLDVDCDPGLREIVTSSRTPCDELKSGCYAYISCMALGCMPQPSSVPCHNLSSSSSSSENCLPYENPADPHSCSYVKPGSVTYERQTYKTVKIGSQWWMAENLNYDAPGSKCGNALTLNGTFLDAGGLCDTHGRLYDWATAMKLDGIFNNTPIAYKNCFEAGIPFDENTPSSDCPVGLTQHHQGICPDGWHIPSEAEWNALIKYVHEDNGLGSYTSGSSSYAGKYLKAIENNGEDKYGFAALPGGFGTPAGNFGTAGDFGWWWSSTEYSANDAHSRIMRYNHEDVYRDYRTKTALFSVRCIQD
jgi:uncharacterized protein (TIGR02145 family)